MKKETKKEWFLDRYCGHQLAALLENGVLTEFFCEKEKPRSARGNEKSKSVKDLQVRSAALVLYGVETLPEVADLHVVL